MAVVCDRVSLDARTHAELGMLNPLIEPSAPLSGRGQDW